MKFLLNLCQTFFLCAILICTASQMSHADNSILRIAKGASSKEVISLLGSPLERIEKEIKRQSVWIYASGKIIFSQGKAVSLFVNGNTQDVFSADYRKNIEPIKPANSNALSNPVEDILSEILREVPSEGGTDASANNLAPGEVRPLDVGR